MNSSNSLQTQYTYDPFGNVTTSGTASSYPFLFGGMELDSSGLYHTFTRTYGPAFGRFLSEDAGLAVNAFIYADDDPIDATDPTGMSPQFVSSAGGMSAGSPDFPVQAAHSNPAAGDNLAGAMLAQYFPPIVCCNGGEGVPNGIIPGFWVSGTSAFALGLVSSQQIAQITNLIKTPGHQNVTGG